MTCSTVACRCTTVLTCCSTLSWSSWLMRSICARKSAIWSSYRTCFSACRPTRPAKTSSCEKRNRRRSRLTQLLVPRLAARAWWPACVSVAAADCVGGMVVTRGGLVAYGLLGMNAPSTLRAGSASCVEAIAEVDSLGLVKRLVVTLPTQLHSAVRFYRSTHGAVQNSLFSYSAMRRVSPAEQSRKCLPGFHRSARCSPLAQTCRLIVH